MKPLYTIEVWPHGWTLSSPRGETGIPMNALNDCVKLFPKGAGICCGITHHLKMTNYPEVVICIATDSQAAKWEKLILEANRSLSPQHQWWYGLDVGKSSASIFSCFCNPNLAGPARAMGGGSTPSDYADFGRCSRLIEAFPEWKSRLDEVASAFKQTRWPAIIDRWEELVNAVPAECNRILDEIHRPFPA